METSASWDDLRVLLAVHRQRSFLAAGRVLGMSTSTTSRRIEALEKAIGRRLVNRGRTGAAVEPDAFSLVRLAESLEHGLGVVRRDAETMAGTVKLSLPEGMVDLVTQALLAVRREHPEIEMELVGENKLSDVGKREADIGIRIARSTSRVLVEKRIGTFRMGLYASTDYVARNLPTRRLTKQEAARHSFIGLDSQWKGLPHEQWMVALGAKRFPFRASSVTAIVEAVRQGAGVAALVEPVARRAGFVRIETDVPGPTNSLYLVMHRELRTVPRIRAVVAAIEGFLREY